MQLYLIGSHGVEDLQTYSMMFKGATISAYMKGMHVVEMHLHRVELPKRS